MLLEIFKSTVVRYLFVRYFAYAIQFANSILLLSYFEDYKYGIYSFCLMVISYVSYFNLGLNQSVSTILSVKKEKHELVQKVWSSVLGVFILVSSFVFVINTLIIALDDSFLAKYEYNIYGVIAVSIGLIINFNLIFVSLYRIYNKYGKINFNQIFPPLITIVVALLYGDSLSLIGLLRFILVANIFSLLLFIINTPLKNVLLFKKSIMKICLVRGVNLMLYNFAFQYITIASITMVSVYFNPADLGYFNLALSISNACVMLVASVLFMIYPKMINRLSIKNTRYRLLYLVNLKKTYVVSVDLILLSILICSIILTPYFSEYSNMLFVLKISLLGQLFLNTVSGVSTMIIADKNETILTKYGVFSIVFVFVLSFLIERLSDNYYNMSFSILGGLFLYVVCLLNYCSKILKISFAKVLFSLFDPYKIAIIIIILFSCYCNNYFVVFIMLLLLIAYFMKYRVRLMIEIKLLLFNNDVLKI